MFQSSRSVVAKHHFSAYIMQDGQQIPIDQHIAKVRRAPFSIVIEMQDKEGVFVSGSFNSSTYSQAIKNIPSNKLEGFKKEAIYELWKNPDNELLIEGQNPNFWFIDSPTEHRFSSYEKVNGWIICERKVSHFYDLEKHQRLELSNVSKPLYLNFIKFKQEGENYRSLELMRHGFKIEWID